MTEKCEKCGKSATVKYTFAGTNPSYYCKECSQELEQCLEEWRNSFANNRSKSS
jgi:hypothetical protein